MGKSRRFSQEGKSGQILPLNPNYDIVKRKTSSAVIKNLLPQN
jgi:hypothetical protein